jgi:hypothetical protein
VYCDDCTVGQKWHEYLEVGVRTSVGVVAIDP